MLRASISTADYFTLAAECRTQNQFNKLHIHYENILAPLEFAHFARLSAERGFHEWSRIWLRKIGTLSPGLFEAPKGFSREPLSENILLYRDRSVAAAGKTLLIGFAGNARRLMLPISVFLQCLNPQAWDLVLLRKGPEKRSYLEGLEGECQSFVELLERVDRLVPAGSYRRLVTLGTSNGGFPAVLAALFMDAARGVSICGASPRAPLPEWLQWQLAMHCGFAAGAARNRPGAWVGLRSRPRGGAGDNGRLWRQALSSGRRHRP